MQHTALYIYTTLMIENFCNGMLLLGITKQIHHINISHHKL